MQEFLSFPLCCNFLISRGEKHPVSNLATSVSDHIYFLLSAKPGSKRFDQTFGNDLVAFDFETPKIISDNLIHLAEKIKNQIIACEKRLKDIKVRIMLVNEDAYFNKKSKIVNAKKRIEISVTARFLSTNVPYEPTPFVIYFSPAAIAYKKGL